MLSPGAFLNGRYEVVKRIGTGGMADVYQGKDHKLKRFVAIKVLKIEFAQDISFVKKFQIEAEAAAGIMHPNIVNVYDVGEDSGYNYMVMELVEGITLKEYVEKKGRLMDKEAISIAIQMASGLQAVHSKLLVHRDIKPQNVMISREGKVKVTDFGIAKPTSSDTVNSNAMGSVHYTSPEQARGGVCNIHSDIYSMGITVYEMITGVVPFDGTSTVEIALKHLQEDMLPASEYVPDIYYSLERIIIKCTQKNPDRRYESMNDLMLDLKRALSDPDGDFVNIGPMMYGETQYTKVEENQYDDEDEYDDDDDDDEYDEDDYNEYEDDSEERMKKITKILAIIVAVIITSTVLFVAGRTIGFFRFGEGDLDSTTLEDMIEVPNLVGLKEDEAKELLEELGLNYSVRAYEESLDYEEGYIIAQSYELDEMVEANTVIKVTISTGITEVFVIVPDLIGSTEESAQSELNKLGLKMLSETAYSDEYEQGTIISSSPESLTEVAEESTVTVVVSMGAEKITVPNVVGSTQQEAQSTIEGSNLQFKVVQGYSDTVATGKVVSQDIEQGRKVDKSTVITCVISKGPETISITMPSTVGMTKDQAKELLESAEYEFIVGINETYSASVTQGYVISSSVSAGATIEKGSTVTLQISMGPEPVQETVSPEVDNGDGTTDSTLDENNSQEQGQVVE